MSRRRKRLEALVDPYVERVAKTVSRRILRWQRRWAAWMARRMLPYDPVQQRWIWMGFFLLVGGYCLYLLFSELFK